MEPEHFKRKLYEMSKIINLTKIFIASEKIIFDYICVDINIDAYINMKCIDAYFAVAPSAMELINIPLRVDMVRDKVK